MMKRMLQNNHDVFDFGQIDDAITCMDGCEFDVLVIKDHMNERSDAASALATVKNLTNKKLIAVAIMEYASKVQREYLVRAGFQEVISKPIDINYLSVLLSTHEL